MEYNALISIRGIQEAEGSEDQVVELVTEGSYSTTPSGCSFTYRESSITGLEGTTTTFDIDGGIVTMTRSGEINSQMVFEKGRKHFSIYETPFGALTVGIASSRVSFDFNECGGDIAVDYDVEVDHALTGSNSFRINIKC